MLKKGAHIKAKLIEAVEKDQWIVSFQGELLQVHNSTDIEFKEGLMLRLQVVRENPLAFKIITKASNKRHLDLHV